MKNRCLLTTAGLLSIGALASTSVLAQAEALNTRNDGAIQLAQADHRNMPMPMNKEEAGSGESVQGRGTVQKLEAASRKVTLAHEPIPEWQWPSMTMTFDVAQDVDLSKLEEGAEIEFSVVRPEAGGQMLTEIRLLEE